MRRPLPTTGGADACGAPDGAPVGASGATWRERAVERSLREARVRAQDRSDRFLAAARVLLAESGTTDFTVQQLVERTRMSLRSFYQHFGSKDELLLVLFSDSLRTSTTVWREACEEVEDPLDRLRVVVEALYASATEPAVEREARSMRALALYHLQLADQRPAEFAGVLVPLEQLLTDIVASGVALGRFRSDLGIEPLTLFVLHTLVSAALLQLLTNDVAAEPPTAGQLWAFLCPAVVAAPSAAPGGRGRRAANRGGRPGTTLSKG